jgi:muconate cycloisomerase
VDAALLDLCGKLVGLPVWRLLGLERTGPPTMYSLGIGPPRETGTRAGEAARRFRMLKLKLGAGDGLDVARVQAARQACDLPVAVDVNGAWSLDEALEILPALAALNVTLVEQPLAPGHPGGPLLKQRSPVPIYLDEECRTSLDVAAAARSAHGINVKLMKAGGVREAIRCIHTARALGLGVILGCGMESTLGIAAACQIASLADYVDLDGNLLLADEGWTGVELSRGIQVPSLEPGLGVREALPDLR